MQPLRESYISKGIEIHIHFHSDHLGSASWISNSSGAPVQHLQYRPFGEPFVDEKAVGSDYDERFTFTGKERDEETGYYYFDARYYISELSIFATVDPLSDKKPHVSAYAYCLNNPIRFIDPDGRDEWEVNSNGEKVNCIKTTKHDAFYRVDDDGNRLEGKENSVVFKYGTVKERNPKIQTTKGEKTLLIFDVNGDESAADLFNFLTSGDGSDKVEWGHVKVGADGSGRNLLGTTNEGGSSYMTSYALLYDYTIRESNHNHPLGTQIPSEGDVDVAKKVSDKFRNATFNIYVNPRGLIPYNKNSDYLKPNYSGATTGTLTPGKKW